MMPAMSHTLLFASPDDAAEEWVPLLRAAIPDLAIRVWPDVGDPAAIDFAVVWRPPRDLLTGLPKLKVVFSTGAGVDAILASDALPAGVPLVRMIDEGLTEGMTEYVVLHALAWHRKLRQYQAQQRARVWRQLPETLARDRKVGVMGLGVLGADAARALAALRFDVSGWSRTAKAVPGVRCFHGADELPAFLARSEILVCLLPLTADTRGILDARLFGRMPAGAVLINAARGGHLVEADLLAALDDGWLAGATLDVFGSEPLPVDHPFWDHPAIEVTPHVAAVTHPRTAVRQITTNIRNFIAGRALEGLVDRRRGY